MLVIDIRKHKAFCKLKEKLTNEAIEDYQAMVEILRKLVGEKMRKKKKSKARDINKEYPKPMDRNTEVEKDEEKPFDFGGLPNRDLKKNLGCG